MLVHLLLNLRNVTFEFKILPSPYESLYYMLMPNYLPLLYMYESLVLKCLAMARLFSVVPGLQIRWVGSHVDTQMARVCSE